MEGAFFLFVIMTVIGSLMSEYVKGVNHAGEHYSN